MSAGKHTEGPWTANGLSVRCGEGARENTSICTCTPNFRDDGSPYANARLIAAAPDMLAALKECLDAEEKRAKKLLPGAPASTYCAARLVRIRAAIAKAEGRADA